MWYWFKGYITKHMIYIKFILQTYELKDFPWTSQSDPLHVIQIYIVHITNPLLNIGNIWYRYKVNITNQWTKRFPSDFPVGPLTQYLKHDIDLQFKLTTRELRDIPNGLLRPELNPFLWGLRLKYKCVRFDIPDILDLTASAHLLPELPSIPQ